MLAKLKTECGFQFTQKMEGMFNDIRLSEDTTKAYAAQVGKSSVGFYVAWFGPTI